MLTINYQTNARRDRLRLRARFAWWTLCFLFLSLIHTAGATEPVEYRKLFYKASADKGSIQKFMSLMEHSVPASDPLVLCYKGAAYILGAKIYSNPYTKLSTFKKGREMLDNAAEAKPTDVEIRFIRFCIQTNAPFFLNYSGAISQDKAVILKHWNALADKDLKARIKDYLLQSKYSTADDRKVLTN